MNLVGPQFLLDIVVDCEDVRADSFLLQEEPPIRVYLYYCEGMCNIKLVNETIMRELFYFYRNHVVTEETNVVEQVPFQLVRLNEEDETGIARRLFSGELILYFEVPRGTFCVDLAEPPHRAPEEPSTEVSIRGPKDGFTEELMMNVALVRKRLKTNKLAVEQYIMGENTQTLVALLYMRGIIEPSILAEIRTRLERIRSTGIFSATQLEDKLLDSPINFFPLYQYTGRPDFAANSLEHGRFLIIVDGVPSVMIAPVNMTFLLNSAEDANAPTIFVAFTRLFRLIGMNLAIFLPGFWIALLTYHQDQIPLTLLATLVISRQGVPIPSALEGIIMLLLFELLKEAGLRLPSAIGQTLSVVGGLIIGQAAISAGMTAPGILVIMAISIVATFTLGNQNLLNVVSLLRLFVLLVSAILGMFGFLFSILVITLYLANLRSFGMPYLSPLSPPILSDLYKVLFRIPWLKSDRPPKMMSRGRGGENK